MITGAPDRVVLAGEDLVVGYGDMTILHGVSIEARDRELVAIIGPNGSGKSTLMKALCGLLKPRSGAIRLLGEEVTELPPRERLARGLTYVPQLKGIFTNMTVAENLKMGTRFSRSGEKEARDRVLSLLPDLRERLYASAGALSGGQQQMVAIGRALMSRPKVLLLDEPSGGLSPKVVGEVFERVRTILEQGVAVIMVEQNARKALEIADHGYVLAGGQTRLYGTGRELLRSEEVRGIYLGEA